jgi:Peptidase family S41/N-terminal domain of Peptidase_S41 in eukaryotic IRBP
MARLGAASLELEERTPMSLRVFLVTILFLVSGLALADAPAPLIPDTPAGHALSLWLEAFNSGDRARLEAFIKTYTPTRDVDREMGFRMQTGGFDLLSIEESTRTEIAFRVKERVSATQAIGVMQVKDADPAVISNFNLGVVPPGAKFEEVKLDAAARTRVIDGVVKLLGEFYVLPDIATKMTASVRARQKHGEYNAIVDGDAFAERLTHDLREVSPDKHLSVRFSPVVQPLGEPEKDPEAQARYREHLLAVNCGFEKAEHLSPNIGYLKFNFFADPGICGPTAVAAMNFLAESDAVIFDLRENGGGDPRMIAFISTYLFDKPTHLNDLYNRKKNTTDQYWTLPYVPGKKLAEKPVFVLISRNTFSGAEEFSYNLKMLKRATLVGETTGGGAHPVAGHRIDDHFSINVPFARAINPISRSNWEGTGVEPDIKVLAADALTEAVKRASQPLNAKPTE